jgi:hypothetical protein
LTLPFRSGQVQQPMVDRRRKRETQAGSSERRTSPRYEISTLPEIEIIRCDDGASVRGNVRDLSQGGCSVETDCVLPVNTDVMVILTKSGDQVRADAQIVWTVPKRGLGLSFTSMDGKGFQLLESWLSIYVAAKWASTNRMRAQRVAMQIEVRVSGYDHEGVRFMESTRTVVVSALGGSVSLRTPVVRGQRVVLTNVQSRRTVECIIVHAEVTGSEWKVDLAFIGLYQDFWPVDFPPADWSIHHPDAKRSG